jgi:hypothetical protein
MCGRFVQRYTWDDVVVRLQIGGRAVREFV